MVYVLGSAFYGIYFLFSFPMFYYFDADVDKKKGGRVVGLWGTVVEVSGERGDERDENLLTQYVQAAGMSMLVLITLDVVRVYLGFTFVMKSRDHIHYVAL